MEFLTNLLENSTMPWLSALVLGLMTAISPCPLATNITAVGFISKDIENRNRVFVNGLLYTLGRAISYTAIALIIYFGADQFKFSGFFQLYGEKILGPLLIIIGLFMLDVIKIKFPGMNGLTSKMKTKTKWGFFDAILLGMIFALAFCPYSGVLYFGMLVPYYHPFKINNYENKNTMYLSGMKPGEVMDLIPVKPIGENETQIKAIYQEKLMGLFEKINTVTAKTDKASK